MAAVYTFFMPSKGCFQYKMLLEGFTITGYAKPSASGDRGGGVHGAFGAEGFGVGDAVLVAQSVKIRLGNQLIPQLRRDVRRDAVRGQLCPGRP